MKVTKSGFVRVGVVSRLIVLAAVSFSPPLQAAAAYTIQKLAQFKGTGGIDYVHADNANRRLYVPRGDQVLVFHLDTLAEAGAITNARAHGVAVDPQSGHGFCSSRPVVMWDAKTLDVLKIIDVGGRPDGIFYEPFKEQIYILSHTAPNVTVLNGKDGSVAGTIDLGGAPEQGASDGQGRVFIDLVDKDAVAVVDAATLKVTARYSLQGKGGRPAGMGLDATNGIIFALCRQPATCVVLSAADGKILATLPIGNGTDGGRFNPATQEAFSSQGDGTLTIIKESSPTNFAVEQTLETKPRAKTCTLDTKNNRIILITTEPAPVVLPERAAPPPLPVSALTSAAAQTVKSAVPAAPATNLPVSEWRDANGGPSLLDILVVGR